MTRTSNSVPITSQAAWHRLHDIEFVLARQPGIARAVRCLTVLDQLELTLQLLRQSEWPDFREVDELPPNVVRFRPRVSHHAVSGALLDALFGAGDGR